MAASKNLSIVQLAHGNPSSTPLVLLHDGGGTVLSYQALGPLDRDVYGISDPRFDIGRPWEGGIPEMARVYTEMIKQKIPHKSILLGGWSFGGFLALEIAHLVAKSTDNSLDIAGLIFIDTPYPQLMEGSNLRVAINSALPELVGVKPSLRRKIHSSIKNARSMLAAWKPPKWDPETETGDLGLKNPPPTILLRASSAVSSRKNDPVAVVDVFRQDPSLGWNQYEKKFIQVVWDIPGNHNSIFGASNVSQTTARLGNACTYLTRRVTV